MINIKYKIVDVDVPVFVPEYKTQGSSGMDICSSYEYIIPPAHTVVVKTNISVEIPNGFEIQIRSRSGMSANHSVFVLNGVGTIDSDYTGEIMVILHNAGKNDFKINIGDRIAQIVLASVNKMNFVVSSELNITERGSGGLGSTGIK